MGQFERKTMKYMALLQIQGKIHIKICWTPCFTYIE